MDTYVKEINAIKSKLEFYRMISFNGWIIKSNLIIDNSIDYYLRACKFLW